MELKLFFENFKSVLRDFRKKNIPFCSKFKIKILQNCVLNYLIFKFIELQKLKFEIFLLQFEICNRINLNLLKIKM